MRKIGIVTADSPETDHSLMILREISVEEECEICVINPFSPIDRKAVQELDLIVPRITGRSKENVLEQIGFYVALVKKYKLLHIGRIKLLPLQKDKFVQSKLAVAAGLLVPETELIQESGDYLKFQRLFGSPFIVKSCYSWGGNDVFLINDKKRFEQIISDGRHYIAQKFIKLDQVVDHRVYVMGDEVVGGFRRENLKKGEFRANTRQGGRGKFYWPKDELCKLALQYARRTKIELLSVDFIIKDGKYYFIESNDAFAMKLRSNPVVLSKAFFRFCKNKIEEKQNG